MTADTLHASQPATPLIGRAERGIAGSGAAEIRAVIQNPEDARAVRAFLKTLSDRDATAPRDDDLSAALIAAIAAPDVDVTTAQDFVQRSLCADISASRSGGDCRVSLRPSTAALITALLHHRCNTSLPLESVLIDLRTSLLDLALTGAPPGAQRFGLAEAMARHSFMNEYIWNETEAETAAVDSLTEKVSKQIGVGAEISAFDLYVIGAYRPLDEISAVRDWIWKLGQHDVSALDPTLRLVVHNRLQEQTIAIETLTPVTSSISAQVQLQYEQNPYPRWRHLPTPPRFDGVRSYVAAMLGHRKIASTLDPGRPRVLVAGAGAGSHPIQLAQALPTAAVLAIDLSRASLAYATREAMAREVGNISFGQADILRLSDVRLEFDLIESVGVLHHMEDPEAGLRTLVDLLKPGGYMRLGFYSKAARHAVNVARSSFPQTLATPGLAGIRTVRQEVLASADPHLRPLRYSQDAFTASAFRDLVMHVQEHQFALPEISAMLKRNNLKFRGFCNRSAVMALNKMPATMSQRTMCDLNAWDRYEQRNPNTFVDMYEFFCVKR